MVKVLGADISMNHGAVVELTDGELTNYWYYTDIAGCAKLSKDATRLTLPKTKDKHVIQMTRLAFFDKWFCQLLDEVQPEYLGIEDYALDAGRNAQHTGEIGGAARNAGWHRGLRVRLHDPMTVKMFGAHNGLAQKIDMEKAVAKRWGKSFSAYNMPAAAPKKTGPHKGKIPKQTRTTSEDLCDAIIIAKMLWCEINLRQGKILLSSLHEKEIRVFNRMTKFMPMNLLDRDWIQNMEAVKVVPKKKKVKVKS